MKYHTSTFKSLRLISLVSCYACFSQHFQRNINALAKLSKTCPQCSPAVDMKVSETIRFLLLKKVNDVKNILCF